MKTKSYTIIKPDDYLLIKSLLSTDLKPTEIHKITKRSLSTVHLIRKSESFENYKELARLRFKETKPKTVNHKEEFEIVPVDEYIKLRKEEWSLVVDILQRMTNVLEKVSEKI